MNLAPRTPAPRSDYAASHDAHMRSTYGDPWDVQPTDDPASGDPLTGTYGRTYAESGALLMQATGDMFGPVTGYAPILLFATTNVDQAPILHASTGGARLTHVNTFDTWDAALRGLRTHVRPIALDSTPSVFHVGRGQWSPTFVHAAPLAPEPLGPAPVSPVIVFGQLWQCCPGYETHVITFDDGVQHAVCASCAGSARRSGITVRLLTDGERQG